MKVSTLLVSAMAATGAIAAPTPESESANNTSVLEARAVSQATRMAKTNYRMWDISLPTFISYRNKKDPSYLDWSSDGCTDSPDNPLGFPFLNGCRRHDFGYRNYKKEKRFTYNNRLKIDKKLLSDLNYQCSKATPLNSKARQGCNGLASTYYAVLRAKANLVQSLEELDPLPEGEEQIVVKEPDYMEELKKYNAAQAELEASGELNEDGTYTFLPEEPIPDVPPEDGIPEEEE